METKTSLTGRKITGEGIDFTHMSELEDQTMQIVILANQVKSLLCFLGNFFSAESIEPNQNNIDAHNEAVLNILSYPHYRNLFDVINQNAAVLKENAESAMNYVESLFDLIIKQ